METRTNFLIFLAFLIVVGYLGLGTYVLLSRHREKIAWTFAGICFNMGGIYLLFLFLYVPDVEVLAQVEVALRLRWVLSAFGPALYLNLSKFYFSDTWSKFADRLVPLGYITGGILAVIISFTDYFVAGVKVRPTQLAIADQGPLFPLFWLYFFVVFVISFAGLVVSLSQTRSRLIRQQIAYLLVPMLVIIILTFAFGNDTWAMDPGIIPNEVGQALLLLTLWLFARGVLVYGTAVGRPLNTRRFLLVVFLCLVIGFALSALLTLDLYLTRYIAFPLPVLTTLVVIIFLVLLRAAEKPLFQLIDRLTENDTSELLPSETEISEQITSLLDESQWSERFLKLVCQSFNARGGMMLTRETKTEAKVMASWLLPHINPGMTVELPPLPVQEPQLITSIFPYLPPDSLWQEMELLVPFAIQGNAGKLVLTGKQDGNPYTHQEISACAMLPELYHRLEKSRVVGIHYAPADGETPVAANQKWELLPSVSGMMALTAAREAAVAIFALRSLEVLRYGERATPADWGSEKAKGLLAYLLWKGDEGATREELSEALWPEKTGEEASNVFHVTLHRLRSVLEPTRKRGSHYVLFEHNRYRLNVDDKVWIDTNELIKANQEGDLTALSQAVELYHGGYLEDVAWALPPEAEIARRRYERLYENALRILIQKLTPREREIYLYRLLQLVPADQEAHELLLADYLATDRLDLARSHMDKLRKLSVK